MGEGGRQQIQASQLCRGEDVNILPQRLEQTPRLVPSLSFFTGVGFDQFFTVKVEQVHACGPGD